MARAEVTIRESSGGGVQLQALTGTVGMNLTGYGTVTLYLRDNAGAVTTTDNITGNLTINGTATGSVLWYPGSTDLLASLSPYQAYLKVQATAGRHFFVGEDAELTITVREKFA